MFDETILYRLHYFICSKIDPNPTESWVYTLGETELRRLANAFNIYAARVVPILKDRVVRYIKKRAGDTNIPWEADDTLDASQPQIRDDQTVSRNRLTYRTFRTRLRLTPTPWLPPPRRPRQQSRPAQARDMQRIHRRIPQPTQGPLHRILKMHPGSYLLRTRPRARPFRAI